MALVALEQPWGEAFCKSVFIAQFADGEDIGTQEKIDELACRHGAGSADIGAARSQRIKDALRVQTEIAVTKGIFGAPSFVVGDELFWGDDRLEDAIAFAVELP
jgi:2-hydroxychromene-2-carboxylate isomerase